MLRPPEHFGRAARKEFRRIVTELEGAGINPATRVALIVATLEADPWAAMGKIRQSISAALRRRIGI